MIRHWFVLLLAAAAIVVVAPARGAAQVPSGTPRAAWGRDPDGGWDPRRDDRDRRRDDDRDRGRGRGWDGRRIAARGHGPAFCRSGAGHPVHGRRWCIEKGFGLGSRYGTRRRASLADIILRLPQPYPRDGRRRNATVIDGLEDVLTGQAGARSGGRDIPHARRRPREREMH